MPKRKTFSEAQYEFGFLFELVNHLKEHGWTAPYIPSQREEKNCGYDAKLKNKYRTLFIQFKKSSYRKTSRSKHWSDHGKPFYQFNITKDSVSHQHNNLVRLARNPKFKVFYCAPGFTTNREYYTYFNNNELIKKSIFVDCEKLTTIRGRDRHTISFDIEPIKHAVMHSHKYYAKAYDYESVVAQMLDAESYDSLEECVTEIARYLEINVDTNKYIGKQLEDIQIEVWKKYKTHLFIY